MKRKSKNQEKKMRIRVGLAAAVLTVSFSACGSSKSAYSASAGAVPAAVEEAVYENAAYDAGVAYDMAADYEYEEEALAAETAYEGGSEQGTVTQAQAATERKLIKTVNISAETEEFDTLVPGLQKQVEALGGYIESISVYDVESYYVEERQEKRRMADLTARVPKEKLDGFLAQVGEQTNVTSRSENVEDVTLQYVDLESHKKALLTEQERLLTLLGQAESVEDIIAIEGRLSEVRYQLESMESQLRTYDNRIDYSTVYLSIEEVRKYSTPQSASVWQRIQSGFVKSLENIGFGIRDLAIYFVIDLPYIILALLGLVVAFFVLLAVLRGKLFSKTAGRLRRLWALDSRKKTAGEAVEDAEEDRAKVDTEKKQE